MTAYHQLTAAESAISGVVGENFVRNLRKLPPGEYPGLEFAIESEKLGKAAEADISLLHHLENLEFTAKDDPRVREFIEIALRIGRPNTIEEIAASTLPDLNSDKARQFLATHAEDLRADRIVIPRGLVARLHYEEDPDKATLHFADGADNSKAYVLLDSRKFDGCAGRANILVSDGTNWLQSLLRGPKIVNALLSWIDENGTELPSVVRAISVFDKAFQEGGRTTGMDEQNYVHVRLHRSGKSFPSGTEGHTLL